MSAYKEMKSDKNIHVNDVDIQTQNPTIGTEKLAPQLAEFLAAVEDEFRRLKMQIADLQRQIGPWNQFLHNRFDEEIDRKLGRKNQFVDKMACEASPMQQFKYKYNV